MGIYANSYYINNICPQHLKKDLSILYNLIVNQFTAITDAGINPFNNNVLMCVPDHIIESYENLITEINNHVFLSFEKPNDYDFIFLLLKYLSKLSNKPLNIKNKELLEQYGNYIELHPFTKTGRLSCVYKTFPILNLKKEDRIHIVPNNSFFFELDFNGAEIRTIFALAGLEQPQEDIYQYIAREFYNDSISREQCKKNTILNLYKGDNNFHELSSIINFSSLKEKFFYENYLITPFGKKIECNIEHFINYLCQSTSAYNLFISMMKLQDFLVKKKSYVAFVSPDSIIIDYHDDDIDLITKIADIFANTVLGKFVVNKKIGYNFFEMEKI